MPPQRRHTVVHAKAPELPSPKRAAHQRKKSLANVLKKPEGSGGYVMAFAPAASTSHRRTDTLNNASLKRAFWNEVRVRHKMREEATPWFTQRERVQNIFDAVFEAIHSISVKARIAKMFWNLLAHRRKREQGEDSDESGLSDSSAESYKHVQSTSQCSGDVYDVCKSLHKEMGLRFISASNMQAASKADGITTSKQQTMVRPLFRKAIAVIDIFARRGSCKNEACKEQESNAQVSEDTKETAVIASSGSETPPTVAEKEPAVSAEKHALEIPLKNLLKQSVDKVVEREIANVEETLPVAHASDVPGRSSLQQLAQQVAERVPAVVIEASPDAHAADIPGKSFQKSRSSGKPQAPSPSQSHRHTPPPLEISQPVAEQFSSQLPVDECRSANQPNISEARSFSYRFRSNSSKMPRIHAESPCLQDANDAVYTRSPTPTRRLSKASSRAPSSAAFPFEGRGRLKRCLWHEGTVLEDVYDSFQKELDATTQPTRHHGHQDAEVLLRTLHGQSPDNRKQVSLEAVCLSRVITDASRRMPFESDHSGVSTIFGSRLADQRHWQSFWDDFSMGSGSSSSSRPKQTMTVKSPAQSHRYPKPSPRAGLARSHLHRHVKGTSGMQQDDTGTPATQPDDSSSSLAEEKLRKSQQACLLEHRGWECSWVKKLVQVPGAVPW